MAKNRRYKKQIRKIRNTCIYVFLRILLFVADALPRKTALAVFGWAGRLVFRIPTSDKKRTLEQIKERLGANWVSSQVRAFGERVYVELAKNTYDGWRLSHANAETLKKTVRVENLDLFKRAYDQGKGIVSITSHQGCFELQLQYFPRIGYPCFTVGRELFDERVDKMVQDMRTGKDMVYLHRKGSARHALKYLKKGWVFGVLVDQDTGLEGVFSHFLGKIAHTPSAPMRMAMKMGVPVVVATSRREKDGTHVIKFWEQLTLEDTGDFDRDLCANIERANKLLSQAIMEHPEQWVWMHNRWKKQPADPRYTGIPNIENYRE